MKIGIITYHWVPNFGANLQTLATISLLQHFGHDPYVINYRPQTLVEKYKKSVSADQLRMHEDFLDEFIPQTELCCNLKEVEIINEKYKFDVLISGSDAVFRLDYNLNREDTTFPNPFWLTFAKNNQRKIFFSASSMGTDFVRLNSKTRKEIVKSLEDSKIFIRDKWTREGLEKIDKSLKIIESIDPVFLLKKYFKIPDRFRINNSTKYIILNLYRGMKSDRWIEKFTKIANKNNLEVYFLPNPENNFRVSGVNKVIHTPLHPLEWYSIIENSSSYVGVRFHPIIVAIANKISFIAFDTYQTKIMNRFSSKTFDICYKIGKSDLCKNIFQQKILTPKKTFDIIMNQSQPDNYIKKEIENIEMFMKKL